MAEDVVARLFFLGLRRLGLGVAGRSHARLLGRGAVGGALLGAPFGHRLACRLQLRSILEMEGAMELGCPRVAGGGFNNRRERRGRSEQLPSSLLRKAAMVFSVTGLLCSKLLHCWRIPQLNPPCELVMKARRFLTVRESVLFCS